MIKFKEYHKTATTKAVQFTTSNIDELSLSLGIQRKQNSINKTKFSVYFIDNGKDKMQLNINDYIAIDSEGLPYVIPYDVFQKTYELAE